MDYSGTTNIFQGSISLLQHYEEFFHTIWVDLEFELTCYHGLLS